MKDVTRIITSETHSWRGVEVRTTVRNREIELRSVSGPTLSIGIGLTKEQAMQLGQDLLERAAALEET